MIRLKRIFNLSSLNVALATGICSTAFFKLPDGNAVENWVPIVQLMLCTWLIYITDRLLDIKNNPDLDTERHRFHSDHQYNFQVIAIALVIINIFLLFFEPLSVVLWGAIVAFLVILYLVFIVSKKPKLKEYTMPFIYAIAVLFAPFLMSKSINLSSWILALMFTVLVYQNVFSFTGFEDQLNRNKWRKTVNYLGAINLFLYLIFFSSQFEYNHRFALIIAIISIFNSLILTYSSHFKDSYRWLMDGLLFIPLLLLLF